ncbi:MAG: protease complex subunit PrcB family protein [Candidatus Thorarchaeota archaeon]|jgi:hypothetical protein
MLPFTSLFAFLDPPEWKTGEAQMTNVLWGTATSSRIENTTFLKIVDPDTWMDVWLKMELYVNPVPHLPDIDFDRNVVFAVFAGDRPTGGYFINITSIVVSEWRYDVYILEQDFGGVTQALTYPYHIVRITGYPWYLPVLFHYNFTSYR